MPANEAAHQANPLVEGRRKLKIGLLYKTVKRIYFRTLDANLCLSFESVKLLFRKLNRVTTLQIIATNFN